MRLYHRLYAFFMGYFWLPCPLCGRMFGGHENHGKSIPTDRTGLYKIVCERHK